MADNNLRLVATLLDRTQSDLKRFDKALKQFYKDQAKNAPDAAAKFFKATHSSTEQVKKLGEGSKKLRAELQALGGGLKKLSPEFGALAESMGLFGRVAGPITGSVIALGEASYRTAKKLGEFSVTMRSLRYAAQQSGFSVSQMKNLEQAGDAFGLSADQVEQGATNFGMALLKVRTNYQEFRNTLAQVGFGQFAEKLRQDAGDTNKSLQDVFEEIDKIRKQFPGAGGEQRINVLLQMLGLPAEMGRASAKVWADELAKAQALRSEMGVTPEVMEKIAGPGGLADKFREQTDQTKIIWDAFGTLIAGDVLPDFTKLVKDFGELFKSKTTQSWAKSFDEFIKVNVGQLDTMVKDIQWMLDNTPDWLKKIFNADLSMPTRQELRAAPGQPDPGTGLIDVPGVGVVPSGAATAPAPGGGHMAGWHAWRDSARQAALGKQGSAGVGGAASGGQTTIPGDVLAKARQVALAGGPGAVQAFMAQQGYPRDGNWCGEFAASVFHAVGGTPPRNAAIASNWRNTPGYHEVSGPAPGEIAVRRGPPTGSTGSHVTFVEGSHDGTFTGLGGNQGRWESNFQNSRFQFYAPDTPSGGAHAAMADPALEFARQNMDSSVKVEGTGKIDISIASAKQLKRANSVLRHLPIEHMRQNQKADTGPPQHGATFNDRFGGM